MKWMLRLLPYLIGAAGIGAAYWWAWNNGYDAARAEQQAAVQQHVTRALAQQREQYEQEREIYEHGFAIERDIETRIVTVREQIPQIDTPGCTALGDDWIRLYNDTLPAGGSPAATDSRTPPPGVHRPDHPDQRRAETRTGDHHPQQRRDGRVPEPIPPADRNRAAEAGADR